MPVNDDEINALKSGDEDAWKRFFEAQWKLIYAQARKAGLDQSNAEETVQRVLVAAAKKFQSYNPTTGTITGWLLSLTRWHIENQKREGHSGEPGESTR